jgi:hypothetical protein
MTARKRSTGSAGQSSAQLACHGRRGAPCCSLSPLGCGRRAGAVGGRMWRGVGRRRRRRRQRTGGVEHVRGDDDGGTVHHDDRCAGRAAVADETVAARRAFFGNGNVDERGYVRSDEVIASWFGIASVAVSFDGHVVLLDTAIKDPGPCLGEAEGETYVGTTSDQLVALDPEAVFIGHGHADHACDVASWWRRRAPLSSDCRSTATTPGPRRRRRSTASKRCRPTRFSGRRPTWSRCPRRARIRTGQPPRQRHRGPLAPGPRRLPHTAAPQPASWVMNWFMSK